MKNTLLFVCVMCLSAGALLSQNTDQIKVGTNLKQSIIQTHDGPASFFPSWLNKSIAATANINAPCDSSWAELIATSGICSIWYSDPGLTTVISSGDTLMVNNITADTTVYLSNYAVTAGDSALPLPAHASTIVTTLEDITLRLLYLL